MNSAIPWGLGRILRACGFTEARPPKGARQPLIMVPGGPDAPQLCMLPIDMDPERILVGYGQLKADGMRALHVDGRIISREGVPLDCALHCLPALQRLEQAFGCRMVFDGEYLEEAGYDATMRAFRKGEGEGVFWIFDAVPFDEWVVNKCRQPIEVRMELIAKHLDAVQSPFVGFLTPFWLGTAEAVRGKALELWKLGYEGLVMKRAGSRYVRDKSPDWQRWKHTVTIDATVMDVLQKDGKFRGIMVRGPSGPLTITTGFNEATKRELMADGEERLVEIAYNTKAGSAKPRHARFVRIRREKEGMTK
jgi:ATP-dependent DNA ligase